MFSACGSTTPYGGRVAVARHLFGKTKSSSVNLEGLDLQKVKRQHCVETWASSYDPHILRRSSSLNDLLNRNTESEKSLEDIGAQQLTSNNLNNKKPSHDLSQQCKQLDSSRLESVTSQPCSQSSFSD